MTDPKPIRTRVLKVEVTPERWGEGGYVWRSTDEDGKVHEHLSAGAVAAWAREADAWFNRRHAETPVHTVIDWSDVPPGFEVPDA